MVCCIERVMSLHQEVATAWCKRGTGTVVIGNTCGYCEEFVQKHKRVYLLAACQPLLYIKTIHKIVASLKSACIRLSIKENDYKITCDYHTEFEFLLLLVNDLFWKGYITDNKKDIWSMKELSFSLLLPYMWHV